VFELPAVPQALEIGKGRVVREGKTVAILSLGTRLEEAEKAADQLDAMGLPATVADLRFAKPLDAELIQRLLTTHEVAVTVEEAAVGGLGAHVLTLASDEGLVDAGLKIRTMRLPDAFQEQDKPEKQYAEAGLDADGIIETVLKALRRDVVIVTGAWTNMSIEHTARAGADKGYFMVVPEDACSTMNAEWHAASVNYAMQNVAVVTDVDAVIEAFG
jgi:1-deoxy-D-xylulose-5-phosphate synthase